MKIMRTIVIILLIAIFSLAFSQRIIAQNWEIISAMPTPRHSLCSAVLDNEIYLIGGRLRDHGKEKATDLVEKFNPLTNTWDQNVAHLEEKRYGASAVAFNGKIYVFGGKEDDEIIEKIEVYDPVKNEWKEIEKKMPNPRFAAKAIVINDKIYIIGGSDKSKEYSDKIGIYDPIKNKWDELSHHLKLARASLAAVAIEDTIYVLGGFYYSPLHDVEKLVLNNGAQKIKDMNKARAEFQACVVNNSIYAIGGQGNKDILKSVEKLDLATEEWTEEKDMKFGRNNFAAEVVNGRIYVFGGSNSNNRYIAQVETFTPEQSSVVAKATKPESYFMLKNYPNPFNSRTIIEYFVPQSSIISGNQVSLTIFNLLGQPLIEIVNGYQTPGYHRVSWNGRNHEEQPVPSGFYIGMLKVGQNSQSIKIHLLK